VADKNYCAIARQYIDDVLAGTIPACEIVKNACRRQLEDLERAERDDSEWVWYWSEEAGNRVCAFLENLQHIKGRWKTTTLVLEPWQCFIMTTIFGWVNAEGYRRYRKAYVEVPRKNGKALALDTLIPTPSGWTTMGAIEVGDEVLDEDGLRCTVTATSEMFQDHDCYLLTFSNGEEVVADAGHIWVTAALDEGGARRQRTTEEIFKTQRSGKTGDVNHSITISASLMRVRFSRLDLMGRSVRILDVSRVATVPTKCIAVDAPSKMYLFGKTMLPTHNTFLAAGIALYLLCADGEPGAEIFSAATTRDQAKICWDVAQKMVKKDAEMREFYDVEAGANSISIELESSFYKPLSRDSDSLEGLNPHGAVIDELHAHKNREIFDVLNMATGSRTQPLIFVITTAGDDKTGICYEQHTYLIDLLEKKFVDERYFGTIYTIDDDDAWETESAQRKANPNYGISVIPDDISNAATMAQRAAGAQNTFKTKRLNVWVNVGVAYFNMLSYSRKCLQTKLTEADFYGEDCIAAVDLASKDDVCCLGKMFRRDGERYIFVRHFLPSAVAEPGNHPNHHLYSKWAIEYPRNFILTPGDITDYEFIEAELEADAKNFNISSVGFDPYNATEFATKMMKRGINMVEIGNNVKGLSEPMKLTHALILAGKLRHNGDPVLDWMFGNVLAKVDEKDNVFPKKAKYVNKIDGAITTIFMIARDIAGGQGGSVYERRGLYGA
jgi:phage terminase large subunit-like protein